MKILAEYDLIIAGGGLSALFTAYHVLKSAKKNGRDFQLLVIADRLSASCPAGSHVVLELEGMFHAPAKRQADIARLLLDGLKDLETTIGNENINCRYRRGYEVKSRSEKHLRRIMETMINHGIYSKETIKENSDYQIFKLPKHDFSFSIDGIGQINMPELMQAVLELIMEMGGETRLGERYISHSREGDEWVVSTDKREVKSRNRILIATGAEHQKALLDDVLKAEIIYTMCCVVGPLSPQDAAGISPKPMAFCNTELQADVTWGGLDEKNYLTFGHGIVREPTIENQEKLYQEIVLEIENLYPGLMEKYPVRKSFGPLLMMPNAMPLVRRGEDYDVAGGWAGMGIVGGYTAAMAYASWIINGDSSGIEIFESLQG